MARRRTASERRQRAQSALRILGVPPKTETETEKGISTLKVPILPTVDQRGKLQVALALNRLAKQIVVVRLTSRLGDGSGAFYSVPLRWHLSV
jgi:hypothetical protein